jgi:RNA repair, ligase-Pnkp-associating, region of Hen1
MPLVARIVALPCRGGERFLLSLLEPLGYTVAATRFPLDGRFPAWGDSPYLTVELSAECRLREHYWVGEAEVERLLRHGEGWLPAHPQRESIALRYLKHRRHLIRQTLARLVDEGQADPDTEAEPYGQEEGLEKPISPSGFDCCGVP